MTLGGVVGVRYKGIDKVTEETLLEVLTDGSLLVSAEHDRTLPGYGAIVIDEAHQHTCPTDLLMGLIKQLIEKGERPDLKIIIMSATIDADSFKNFFPGSVIKEVAGRQHNLIIKYLEEEPVDVLEAVIQTILQIHLFERSGNILVFVSGVREINKVIKGVKSRLKEERYKRAGPMSCHPLHAQLSREAEEEAVDSVAPAFATGKPGRKLVVATNVAETSITITGVGHVVDSLRYKAKIWNPREESTKLAELPVSKAMARQRAGRGARTKEGIAWRMSTQAGYETQLEEHTVSAMLETDMLSESLHILRMKLDPVTFPFPSPPAPETVVKALELLCAMGAIKRNGELDPRGNAIGRLQANIYNAVVVLESPWHKCSDEMLSLVAIMEASENGSTLFVAGTDETEREVKKLRRTTYRHEGSDHFALFNIYMAWRQASNDNNADDFVSKYHLRASTLKAADELRSTLKHQLENSKMGWTLHSLSKDHNYLLMLKALAAGNFLRVAKREWLSDGTTYEIVRTGEKVTLDQSVQIGKASAANEWVIYDELHVNKEDKKSLRLVSAIPVEALVSAQPTYWIDMVEFLREGHIRSALIKVLAEIGARSKEDVRGGMPKPALPITKQ